MIDTILDILFMAMMVIVFMGAALLYGDKDLAVRQDRQSDYEAIGYYYTEKIEIENHEKSEVTHGYGQHLCRAE